MEPTFIDLQKSRLDTERHLTVLPTGATDTPLPPGLQEFLDASNLLGDSSHPHFSPTSDKWKEFERRIDAIFADDIFPRASILQQFASAIDASGVRGRDSRFRYFMDGGLRDTLPIRTALRMGATEILVVTGDRVQTYMNPLPGAGRLPSDNLASLVSSGFAGVDLTGIPLFRHLTGLLGIWFNEAARADMLTAIAHNEFAGWFARAAGRLPEASRRELQQELTRYWKEVGNTRYEALGGVHAVGGQPGESRSESFRPDPSLGHSAATIQYLAPDREIIAPLDFDNERAVRDGIELGQRLARDLPLISRG